MLTAEQNQTLTQVGPGTPMGEYFRRFWLPIFIDSELPNPDCDPVRTRILGEDLVAFRDTAGKVGIIDAFCPHRRVPMYFGRNEEGGLRCVYHGRKFDCEGNCVDYPSAPEGSRLKEFGGTKAYPTYETPGLIWIYMGPPELMPERPSGLPVTTMARDELMIYKYFLESNWLQNLEGDIDLEHLHFTHAQTLKGFDDLLRTDGITTDRYAHFETVATDYGMAAAARWKKSNGEYYWRVNQHILPSHMQIPSPIGHNGETSFWIPVDDHHCWRILVWGARAMPMIPGPDGQLVKMEGFQSVEKGTYQFADGVVIDAILPSNRKSNGYGLDRERQRTQNFTGMENALNEDQALTEGMGPILDRTREQLDATDKVIVGLRRRLFVALDSLKNNVGPEEARDAARFNVVPLDTDSPIEDLGELLEAHKLQDHQPV